jgi:AcrR family transcriptional regulator
LVERQTAERRRRILAKTRRFLSQHGVDALNVRALAEYCGVSVPTLYRTFGSKEGLLAEAMQPYMAPATHPEPACGSIEGHAQLLALIEGFSLGFSGPGDDERALMAAFLGSRLGQKLAFQLSVQIQRQTTEHLQRMRELGELEPWADPDAIAQRVAAQSVVAAIECASGQLSRDGYRASFVLGACLLLSSVTRGKAQDAFIARARSAQAASLSRPRSSSVDEA